MAQRITMDGIGAIAGKCPSCLRLYIVSDPVDEEGSRITRHEDPMCPWYIEMCKGAEDLGCVEHIWDGKELKSRDG